MSLADKLGLTKWGQTLKSFFGINAAPTISYTPGESTAFHRKLNQTQAQEKQKTIDTVGGEAEYNRIRDNIFSLLNDTDDYPTGPEALFHLVNAVKQNKDFSPDANAVEVLSEIGLVNHDGSVPNDTKAMVRYLENWQNNPLSKLAQQKATLRARGGRRGASFEHIAN